MLRCLVAFEDIFLSMSGYIVAGLPSVIADRSYDRLFLDN